MTEFAQQLTSALKHTDYDISSGVQEYAEKEQFSTTHEVRLIQIANQLKTFSDYISANMIFGHLLNLKLKKGDESPLELWLETQVENGQCVEEAYYDLLILKVEGEMKTESLNIPITLLTAEALVSAAKCGWTVEDRKKHNRQNQEVSQEKINLLIEEVNKILTKMSKPCCLSNILVSKAFEE